MKFLKYLTFSLALILLVFVGASFTTNLLDKTENQTDYKIVDKWELPSHLEEVSGIDWVSESKIACVEDEDGIIFIYDLEKRKVVQEIEFSDSGDYEDIVIHNQNAYVMRSDGVIFEILRFRKSDRKTNQFETQFSGKNDMESLALDANRNLLLTIAKEKDLSSKTRKGVYQFSLQSKKMQSEPIITIDMEDAAFKDFAKKKPAKTFNPSDIAIHPKTNDIYILEGRRPKLVIVDDTGAIKKVYHFDKKQFPQPEGLIFSSDGRLFISNEGNGDVGTIMEVLLQ